MPALTPLRINVADPGVHELSSDSEEHFSSASEGAPPAPITRVERVDDRPAHGEVPGTPAYALRTSDAVPDEIEIVPEGQRSRSGTRSRAVSNLSVRSGQGVGGEERPITPGGTPIPKTVVERVDDRPAHGEVEGTEARQVRRADAVPDEVRIGESKGR